MKKIIALALVIFIFMFVFVMGVSATEIDSSATPETEIQETTETSQLDVQETQESMIKTILNTVNWASILAFVASSAGTIIFVIRSMFSIKNLVTEKASTKDVKEEIKSAKDETKELEKKIDKRFDESDNKIDVLYNIIVLFIMNSKLNQNAKNEILKYATKFKDYGAKAEDVVETAQTIIDALNDAEEKEETPALDAIVEQGIVLD